MRRLRIGAWAGLLWCAAAAAQAQAPARVVVLRFDGPGAARVRNAVVDALSKDPGFEAVGEKDARNSAASQHVELSSEAGRVAVARELSLSAFVEGHVEKHGARSELSLRVFGGSDGSQLGEASIRARSAALPRHVKKGLIDEIGEALSRARPPAAQPEPEPEPEPKPNLEPKPAPPPKAQPVEPEPEPEQAAGPRPKALELSAAVRVVTRSYAYRDALLPLAEHTLDATGAMRLEARWYPAAHFTRSFVANLGLDLQAQMLWPVNATEGNLAFKTKGFAFGVAARLRVPLGNHELGVLVGYGGQSLSIADAKGQDPGVPSVSYGFVRMGADGRIAVLRPLSIGLRAAYLLPLGYGELATTTWFPHVSGGGVEAELSLRYAFSELLAADLGGGMARYFFSLNPSPRDAGVQTAGRIAGGATDQYFYGVVGLTLLL